MIRAATLRAYETVPVSLIMFHLIPSRCTKRLNILLLPFEMVREDNNLR